MNYLKANRSEQFGREQYRTDSPLSGVYQFETLELRHSSGPQAEKHQAGSKSQALPSWKPKTECLESLHGLECIT